MEHLKSVVVSSKFHRFGTEQNAHIRAEAGGDFVHLRVLSLVDFPDGSPTMSKLVIIRSRWRHCGSPVAASQHVSKRPAWTGRSAGTCSQQACGHRKVVFSDLVDVDADGDKSVEAPGFNPLVPMAKVK